MSTRKANYYLFHRLAEAQRCLSNIEKERSYSDRLKFYKELAFAFAEIDPSRTLKLANLIKEQLGWSYPLQINNVNSRQRERRLYRNGLSRCT